MCGWWSTHTARTTHLSPPPAKLANVHLFTNLFPSRQLSYRAPSAADGGVGAARSTRRRSRQHGGMSTRAVGAASSSSSDKPDQYLSAIHIKLKPCPPHHVLNLLAPTSLHAVLTVNKAVYDTKTEKRLTVTWDCLAQGAGRSGLPWLPIYSSLPPQLLETSWWSSGVVNFTPYHSHGYNSIHPLTALCISCKIQEIVSISTTRLFTRKLLKSGLRNLRLWSVWWENMTFHILNAISQNDGYRSEKWWKAIRCSYGYNACVCILI